MIKKLYIAFDFDDVIADTVPVVLDMLNQRQPEELHQWKPEDITEWDIAACTGFSKDTVQAEFSKVDYNNVPFVPGAAYVIKECVAAGHGVGIVTSNPRTGDIRDWLDRGGLRDIPLTYAKDKASWFKGRGYNVIVDDNPNTLRTCASLGIVAVRFERPWNETLKSSGAWVGHAPPWGLRLTEKSVTSWADSQRVITNLSTVDRSAEQKMWDSYEEILNTDWQCIGGGVIEDSNGNRWLDGENAPVGKSYKHWVIDEGVITNAKGAKQTDLKARFDLLPARAVEEVARVLQLGATKYGEDNWRGLSVDEIHNHTIYHAVRFNRSRDLEDLANTACRALMALEIFLEDSEFQTEVKQVRAKLDSMLGYKDA